MNVLFRGLTVIAVSYSSCSGIPSNQRNTSHWVHNAVFISDSRLELLRKRISEKTEPTFSAWKVVGPACDRGLLQKPRAVGRWAIPGYYENKDRHEAAVLPLQADSTLAYEEALCFRLTGKTKYAAQSIRIINAWSSTLRSSDPTQADSKLSMCEFFPTMIAAAGLLRPYGDWSNGSREQFKTLLRKVVLPLNTMDTKKNNHANWGTLLVLSVATFLDDLQLLEKAEVRFKSLIDTQISADGTLPLEIDRSDSKVTHGGATRGKRGIWYTNYALMPTTLSAEILSINGHSLYEYRSPAGGSLKSAYERVADWCLHPEAFPYYGLNHGKLKGTNYVSYFEILDILWPNSAAHAMLEKYRPLTADGSFPLLTLTHGGIGPENVAGANSPTNGEALRHFFTRR